MGRGRLLLILVGLLLWAGGKPAEASRWGAEFLGPPVVTLKWGERGKAEEEIRLAGARNEHLHCALVLRDPPPGLKVSLEANPPVPHFEVFRVVPVPLGAEGEVPPDALVPLEEEWAAGAADPQILWITFRIPPDFPSGAHALKVKLAAGQEQVGLPAVLRVYRFTLPEDLPLTLFAGFWHQHGPWNLKGRKGSPAARELLKAYYRRLRDYKFNALGGSCPVPLGELRADTRLEGLGFYHELAAYALKELRFRYIQIPRLPGWQEAGRPDSDFCRRARVLYPLFADYLRRHGWEGRALNYLVDEPSPGQAAAVLQAYRLAKSLGPGIVTLSAGWGDPSRYAGLIDIWAHQAAHYRPEERLRAQKAGQEAWLYINRLHTLGQPLSHPRLIGWLLFQHRFSGYLLWGVNYWPGDPWTTLPGKRDFHRRGTLFYPHPQTGAPLVSLRLEALRRGFQDYQYLSLLEQACRGGKVDKAQCQEIFATVQKMAENLPSNPFRVEMRQLEELRLQAGNLLDEAWGRNRPQEPVPPGE